MNYRTSMALAMVLVLAPALALMLAGCREQATTRDIAPQNHAAPDAHPGHNQDPGGEHPAEEVAGHVQGDHQHVQSDHQHGTPDHGNPATAAAEMTEMTQGKILETMVGGGYSYALLEVDGEQLWTAGPGTPGLAVGKIVGFSGALEMNNFHSRSLDRTFESILFVNGYFGEGLASAGSGHGGGMSGMSGMGGMSGVNGVNGVNGGKGKGKGMMKAAGGVTIEEIHARASELKDQQVTVRGEIVKFSEDIINTNWIHIQDGTGNEETGDLTVTTDSYGKVGDTVIVTGPLSVDKDFGSGYFYHVIIEGATVVKD